MKKKIPILKCQIKHSIRGRIRISCRALKFLEEVKDELEKQIGQVLAIESVKISVVTENILIYYLPDRLNEINIVDIVENILGNYSFIAYKNERVYNSSKNVVDKKIGEESVEQILKHIVSIAGVLFYLIKSKKVRTGIFNYSTLSVIGLAMPVIKNGITSLIKNKRPNADTLSATAIISSVVLGKEKSALSILLLEDISELITVQTMKKTRNAIKDMLNVGDDFVWKVTEEGITKRTNIKEIFENDLVFVQTGEKISVDGIIVKGEASIDQSPITGEYLPATKMVDERVFAGTIIKSGAITIKTERVGDTTAVSRIIKLVEDASFNKAAIQSYADKISTKLIPLNFTFALLVYLFTKNLQKSLSMLVIDYSCGIRLSTATALSSCINTAAKNGILIKGSNYIEEMSNIDTLILDKTGTLTEGNPRVQTMKVLENELTVDEMLGYAAAAEETSNHPLSVSILNEAKRRGITIPLHENAKIIVSRGVETKVDDKIIRVGSKKFLSENGVKIQNCSELLRGINNRGEIPILVSMNNKLIGILGVCDPLRENMKKAINRLRMEGVDDIILLTGDLQHQAELVSNRIGMDRYESELLPEDKAKNILKLQSNGARVAMVGDGINDAPALAFSNVGIALGGKRTDVAMEAADITITSDNPLLLPGIVDLSKATMKTIKENFSLAIGINTTAMVLGATGTIGIFTGALIHNLSTIAVVLNSLRLLKYDVKS